MLDYPLTDVIDLMRHHLDYNRRNRQREASPGRGRSNTQDVIYRKADDSWL